MSQMDGSSDELYQSGGFMGSLHFYTLTLFSLLATKQGKTR